MLSTNVTTAVIIDKDHGKTVECMFNPKEYSFSKQNSWSPTPVKGANMGQYEFGNGQPATLQMQLFFDTYTNIKSNSTEGGTPKDVRDAYTKAIWEMMLVDSNLASVNGSGQSASNDQKGRPPIVIFQWGSTWSFKAVITSLKERFTLFLPDGTPVRSTLDVTFQQIQDERAYPLTNPTSGGVGGERVWKVSEGDTLAWIAYKMYGDTKRWRLIAEANKLTRVRQLTTGVVLEIPNA
jgi:phage tail protein X